MEKTFVIPTSRDELLKHTNSNYTVRDVVIPAQIPTKLEEAQTSFREEGPNFILDHFDTYYSVLHHGSKLHLDVVYKAYTHLHRAVEVFNNAILFVLDDKDSLTDEIKEKTVTVLKMLLYIYIQFVLFLEEKKSKDEDFLMKKGKKQQKNDNFAVNKSKVLNALNHIIQREINLFWEPPIVEHDVIGLLAELCFSMLQNPSIKPEKETILEIFGIFANLIKTYDYGKTFVTRLIQSIRMYEHVVSCVIEGITMIVEQFNCNSLIHHFVKEATEWQVDETYQDVQGARCCAIFLTELAAAMPKLILPEVMYLDKYLAHQSSSLRIAVLNVMTEVILTVLTNHELSQEEKEQRNEILLTIIEHMWDLAANVRSKVIQNLSKLQKENAIPLSIQTDVLKEIITRLNDKGTAVRKSAASALTSFLEHNPYGAYLQLQKAKDQLAEKKQLLNKMETTYQEAQLARITERDIEWKSFENDLKAIVTKNLDKSVDRDEDEEEDSHDNGQEVDKIRTFLNEKKFTEAFTVCQKLRNNTEELKYLKNTSQNHKILVYMSIMHSIFLNKAQIAEELRTGAGMTEEDIRKIEVVENLIKYLENTTDYLQVLDSAIAPMKSLLFSQTMNDTNEAIQFFVTAFQFQVDRSTEGILEMLKMMRCNEQERQSAVVDAFKKIYLVTDTNNMVEHTTTILNRLLALLKDLSYENLDDFQNIVIEWTARGILDNSVIDRCWQYYTKKEPVSNDDARAACEILRMAAMGRNTIITKNISVVGKVMFSERNKTDMMFLASSYRLLAVVGMEKIDIQSKKSPFRITNNDEIFLNSQKILVAGFFLKYPYYSEAMQAGLDFIFRVCSHPIVVADDIVKQISEKLKDYPHSTTFIVRLCEMMGCLAVKLVSYLDNTVYRELKRRNYLREGRKKEKKSSKNDKKTKTGRESSKLESSTLGDANSSVLVGAEAEDADAEFILHILENDVVSKKGLLGQYSDTILNICQRPEKYSESVVQLAAVNALMRYMLVSSKFCSDNIRRLFTILKTTPHPQLKCTILIHCSDLLTRFPNVVEPWSPQMYDMLKDPVVEVRKHAFFALANLILRSMIRAHSHISEMAVCLVDEDPEVNEMCQSFFRRMEQKEHNIVNVLPDVFSHLVRMEEKIDEKSLRYILNYLFDLVDTSKKMDSLIDRFCSKYTPDENVRLNRNITYCLSLVSYNDKALRKLQERFPTYQHHLHDAEIYSLFKQILAECTKTKVGKVDLKPIVAEIEAAIASVFDINEDGPPVVLPKSVKKPKGKQKKRGKKQASESEDDLEESPPSKQKGKQNKKRGKTVTSDRDDDVESSTQKKKKGQRRVSSSSD